MKKKLLEELAELVAPGKPAPQLLRDKLLGSIARPRLRYAPLFGPLGALFDLGDLELAALFENADDPSAWVTGPLPGLSLFHLSGGPRVAHADNGLVRLAPSTHFPMHRHLGSERVLVLEGGYVDAPSGKTYGPGDVHEMAADTSHAYITVPERPTLFAVSLVSGIHIDGFGTVSGQR
jgi:quercetin dioxygenase-like cupin family protein